MAINDIVQTVAEARVDARSLSEFVFKPAGFKVTRRLAPPINTLEYYLNLFNKTATDGAAMMNQVVINSGFITIDSFELGATLTQRNQALRHEADGKLYRWAGDLPKVVPESSTPVSSGGMGDNAWLEVSDATLRQDLANPDMGVAMVGRGVVAVDSLAGLTTLPSVQRKSDLLYIVASRNAGWASSTIGPVGGGSFLWSAVDERDGNDATIVEVPGVPVGRFVRVLDNTDTQLTWFYEDDWDDAIDAAADWLDTLGGGTLRLPQTQDVYIYRAHVFQSPILIEGHRRGSRTSDIGVGVVYVADGITAFKWGQWPDPSRTTRMLGGGMLNVVARGIGYTQGNKAAMYGNQSPSLGYSTKDTSLGGALNTAGTNMTNVLASVGYAFVPFIFEGNQIEGFGYAFRNEAATYNIYPEKNDIYNCGVGIYMGSPGIPTTMGVSKNKIERCAIGVYLNHPSQMVQIIDNVIEANYAGCDVLMYNSAHTVEIERNYFEGTEDNIVVRSDSLNYEPHLLMIRKNTGVKFFARANAIRNTIFEDNWIDRIEFAPYSGGILGAITFRNNYAGASKNPFTPTSGNFILNSVALAQSSEICFNNDNITPSGQLIQGALTLAVNQRPNVFLVATALPSAASFVVEVPNVFVNAVLKVQLLKYTNEGQGFTYGNRSAEYTVGIKRVTDQSCRFLVSKDSDTDMQFSGGSNVPMPDPSITLSGDPSGPQTLSVSLAGGANGGTTGNNLIKVEVLSSVTGLRIRNP